MGTSKFEGLNAKVDKIYTDIITEWKKTLTGMTASLFSGDDASISMLTRMMQNGNMLKRTPQSSDDVQGNATKFLYSILIMEVYRMQGFYPVLLDAAWICEQKGIGIRQWTDKKDVGDAHICITKETGFDRAHKTHTLVDSTSCGPSKTNGKVALVAKLITPAESLSATIT